MKNFKNLTLVDFAKSILDLKVMTSEITDGNIVGVDSVSGSDYMQGMPCLGTIYKYNGNYKVIVDVVHYDRKPGDKYAPEFRAIAVTFNPDTLEMFPSERTNIGFDQMKKHVKAGNIVAVDIASYVNKRQQEIKDAEARAKAEAARKARLAREAELRAQREAQAKVDKANAMRVQINTFYYNN